MRALRSLIFCFGFACNSTDALDTADSAAVQEAALAGSSSEGENVDDGQADPLSGGFPATSCRSGFTNGGSRLCISTTAKDASTYLYASYYCRAYKSHVCTEEDLYYLYRASSLDASYDPNGKWLGNATGDDEALCGNRSITTDGDSDRENFETTCDKSGSRSYWCCHDDDDGS